ncbi:MAG: EpsG family protein [Chryseobacterium sp.]|nr:EpsG family protein [Chryseobacterium sp.]
MFDFVPLEYYSTLHYCILLMIMVIILLYTLVYDTSDISSLNTLNLVGYVFLLYVVLYIGTRPISGQYFTDMGYYARNFNLVRRGASITVVNDYMFNYFLIFCAKIMNDRMYFLVIAILYTIPCYLFSKRYLGRYWFFGFFMFVGSMSFWAYGTNGIRNGFATAIFILALAYYNNKILLYSFLFISFGLHNSIIIPLAAFIASGLYKNPKIYLLIWILAIPLSLIGGSFWENFFSSLGFDDRSSAYLTENEALQSKFSSTGFRWDFLLYSATAVYAGYYYIFKKGIEDKFYIHLFGMYTIANAFWILVIRANFSNRFAYLSWFLMAPVIAYPMLKYKFWKDQYKIFGIILTLYYLFTFVMFFKG